MGHLALRGVWWQALDDNGGRRHLGHVENFRLVEFFLDPTSKLVVSRLFLWHVRGGEHFRRLDSLGVAEGNGLRLRRLLKSLQQIH